MFERFDEAELLALIEGELDPGRAAALRAQLAAEPRAAALIDRLRADRAALRSLPQPEPPADLLAALEPMIARPMLIMDTPGTNWRRRQRLVRRMRWVTAALAACLAIAAVGAAWFTLVPKWMSQPESATALADSRDADGRDALAIAAARPSDDIWPPAQGTIHHRLPVLDAGTSAAVARPAAAGSPPRRAVATIESIPAPFALVIRAGDPAAAEASLREHARSLGDDGALVRNLTFAEVDVLMAEAARGGRQLPQPPRRASVNDAIASEFSLERRDGRRTTVRLPGVTRRPDGSQLTGLLEGRRALGASIEQQLSFSERGATLTISIPAARLDEFLQRLHQNSGHLAMLQPLESKPEQENASPEAAWLRSAPMIQESLATLVGERSRTVLVVPVVIEPASRRRPR